jgi:hypothetical protein
VWLLAVAWGSRPGAGKAGVFLSALGSVQSPFRSTSGYSDRSPKLTAHFRLVSRSRMDGSTHLLLLFFFFWSGVVRAVTRRWAGRPEFDSRQETHPRSDRLWGPPCLLFSGYCSSENAWSYTSTPPYVYLTWRAFRPHEALCVSVVTIQPFLDNIPSVLSG